MRGMKLILQLLDPGARFWYLAVHLSVWRVPKHLLEVAAVPWQVLQKLTRLPLLCCPPQAHCQSQQRLLELHCPLLVSRCLHQQQRQVRPQMQCLSLAWDCCLSPQGRSRLAMRQPYLVQRCCLRAGKELQLWAALVLLHLL